MAPGAKLIVTDTMKQLAIYADFAVRQGVMVMLSMPTGQGKTLTLAALASVAPVPVHHLELATGLRGNALWSAIGTKLLGVTPPGNQIQKMDRIAAALRGQRCLLALDDAQNAGTHALLALRHLTYATGNGFGILLAGHRLEQQVAKRPELDSRIKRRIVLDRVPFPDILAVIVPSHPGMVGVPEDLLRTVHAWTLHQSLREWAELIGRASQLQQQGPFTADSFAQALDDVTGRHVTAAQLRTGVRPVRR